MSILTKKRFKKLGKSLLRNIKKLDCFLNQNTIPRNFFLFAKYFLPSVDTNKLHSDYDFQFLLDNELLQPVT